MNIQSLPKVELHVHLDCSLSYEVVQKINSHITYERFLKNFTAPSHCPDLSTYISKSESAISLMQTAQHLRWVTLDLFDQFQKDGIAYAEIRFAPLEHTRNGLTEEQVVQIVDSAVGEGTATYGIPVGVLLCTLRHYTHQQSMRVARLTREFQGSSVVGMDIAGHESEYGLQNHIPAFEFCRGHGIPCTAHAGESRGADSVAETIRKLRVDRIGHGVRSAENLETVELIQSQNIHLEICPTSNILTRTVEAFSQHPLKYLYDSGISLGINTDGRTISRVSLSDEYRKVIRHFDWEMDELKTCNLAAIKHAFTKDAIKRDVIATINIAYKSK
nr:adenosine deaminase [Saprospiraceae bacterium]